MAVIVYDVTNQPSFDSTVRWANEVKKEAQQCRDKDTLLVLVGNKTDLETERVVQAQDGATRAKEIGATFFEVSATNFDSVKKVFDYIQGYLVPSKDSVPISEKAVAAKAFEPGDFEIDISRDPDDINSVPTAKAAMPSPSSAFDDNDDEYNSDNGSRRKRFGCCPC